MARETIVRGWFSGLGRALALGACAALGGGCSGEGGIATFPVEGSLTVKGEPAPGAFLVFHPVDGGAERPTAQVGQDGAFRVSTRDEGDGAPEGEYAVTVEWWRPRIVGGEAVPGANVLPPEYANPERSPLKAVVVRGENRLDGFEIR
jgi:hypothetical protein